MDFFNIDNRIYCFKQQRNYFFLFSEKKKKNDFDIFTEKKKSLKKKVFIFWFSKNERKLKKKKMKSKSEIVRFLGIWGEIAVWLIPYKNPDL